MLGAGIFVGLMVPIYYYLFGFHFWIVLVWLASLSLIGFALFQKPARFFARFNKADFYALYFLLLIFIPIYFLYLYSVPYQMNTDEPTIMMYQKLYQNNPDVFSNSTYFGFASFIFIATAWAQKILGGISLMHARMVHASMAIAIIVLAFIFFRQFWKTLPSFFAAVVLGSNHALVAISRMAMRDNSALLVEVLSLPFLFFGLKKRNLMLSFIGGALAGFSFYVYQPGRILIFIWLGFLFSLALFMRARYELKLLAKLAGVTLIGFIIVVLPLIMYGSQYPNEGAAKFSRERFLFYPEGQQLQKDWVDADTIKDGIIINIKNGLGTFNNKVHDLGYIYPNFGHGFVDPISGALLWLGFASVCYKFYRRKFTEEDLLNFFAFLGLWLLFAFVINKTPNYTRLFIVLPFFAYLVVSGVIWLFTGVNYLREKLKLGKTELLYKIGSGSIVAAIVVSNLFIFSAFVNKGLAEGDNVGGTARYIEARKIYPDYEFYLVANSNYGYYSWGEDWQWIAWMEVYIADNQSAQVLDPDHFLSELPRQNNFTFFMNKQLWEKVQLELKSHYPQLRVTNIKTDGSLVAIEVIGANAGVSP